MGSEIVIIEDDEELSELLSLYLQQFNFRVTEFSDPREGLRELKSGAFDLLILDLSLPHIDGIELLKELREFSQIPVIISSARGSVIDKVKGLDLGADDYLPKPYEPVELIARVKAILKRVTPPPQLQSDFVIDSDRGEILFNGELLQLTGAEYQTLKLLLESRGKILSREMIADSVSSIQWDSTYRSVDVIISRIRHKIGETPREPKYLKSVRGVGYKLV
jgi:two-component system OmpR family response regulator